MKKIILDGNDNAENARKLMEKLQEILGKLTEKEKLKLSKLLEAQND